MRIAILALAVAVFGSVALEALKGFNAAQRVYSRGQGVPRDHSHG